MLKPHQKPKPKRDKKIFEYKNKGYSLTAIAGIFRISKQRVAAILKREQKLSTSEPIDKLS